MKSIVLLLSSLCLLNACCTHKQPLPPEPCCAEPSAAQTSAIEEAKNETILYGSVAYDASISK